MAKKKGEKNEATYEKNFHVTIGMQHAGFFSTDHTAGIGWRKRVYTNNKNGHEEFFYNEFTDRTGCRL